MPEYQFVVTNQAPKPASSATRSLAMRTAWEMRVNGGEARAAVTRKVAADSQETLKAKPNLKGRFRASGETKKASKSKSKQASVSVSPKELPTEPNVVEMYLLDPAAQRKRRGSFDAFAKQAAVLETFDWEHGPTFTGTAPDSSYPISPEVSTFMDPFYTLAIPINTRVRDYLAQNTLRRHRNLALLSDEDSVKHWFESVMDDPVTFHSSMAITAGSLTHYSPNPDRCLFLEGFHHKTQTINIVNARLSAHEVDMTTTLPKGISSLVRIATCERNFSHAEMHLKALRQLLDLRGGIEVWRYDHGVLHSVLWADVYLSLTLDRRPTLPIIYDDRLTHTPRCWLPPNSSPLNMMVAVYPQHPNDAVCALRSGILSYGVDMSSPPSNYKLCHGRQLVNILLQVAQDMSFPRTSMVSILSSHLFLHAAMRRIPAHMRNRIKGTLMPTDWADHIPKLAWVMAVGAAKENFEDAEKVVPQWLGERMQVLYDRLNKGFSENKLREALDEILQGNEWVDKTLKRFLSGDMSQVGGRVEMPSMGNLAELTTDWNPSTYTGPSWVEMLRNSPE